MEGDVKASTSDSKENNESENVGNSTLPVLNVDITPDTTGVISEGKLLNTDEKVPMPDNPTCTVEKVPDNPKCTIEKVPMPANPTDESNEAAIGITVESLECQEAPLDRPSKDAYIVEKPMGKVNLIPLTNSFEVLVDSLNLETDLEGYHGNEEDVTYHSDKEGGKK